MLDDIPPPGDIPFTYWHPVSLRFLSPDVEAAAGIDGRAIDMLRFPDGVFGFYARYGEAIVGAEYYWTPFGSSSDYRPPSPFWDDLFELFNKPCEPKIWDVTGRNPCTVLGIGHAAVPLDVFSPPVIDGGGFKLSTECDGTGELWWY